MLDYCVRAKVRGIITFGFGTTMRDGSREYFYDKLDEHFPGMKQKYIGTFGGSYICPSPNEARLKEILRNECRRHNILLDGVFDYMYRFESREQQLSLLDE